MFFIIHRYVEVLSMKFRVFSLIMLVMLALVSVVPLAAQDTPEGFPLTIEDRLGRELTFEEPPQRIVCFYNGCMRGFGPLIPGTNITVAWPYDELAGEFIDEVYYPGLADAVVILDEGENLDPEAIAAFEPDLIVAYTEEEVTSYETIAPVFLEYEPKTVEEVVDSFFNYSRIIGMDGEADQIAQGVLDRYEAYRTLAPNDTTFMTVFSRNDGLLVRTSNSSECTVLEGLARCEWEDPTGGEYWSYETTAETVLNLNPDVIYLATEGMLEAFLNDQLITESDAAQNGRIYQVSGYDNPTGQGVMALSKLLDIYLPLLYPDIFPEPLTDEQVQEILAEQSEDAAEGFPVTVVDGAGHELTVDSPPDVVVCMWNGCVSNMAFIGVMPDAVTEGVVLGRHPAYFGEAFDAVIQIARGEDLPDIETILALEPNLVVGHSDGYAATADFVPSYEQNYDTSTPDLFFLDVRNFARMFGVEAETEARLQRLLDRALAYGTISEREKSIYHGYPEEEGNSWWINGGDFSCGFIQPIGQCATEYGDEWQQVTLEGLLSINPDVLIIEDHGFTYGEEMRVALEAVQSNPLYQELVAVQTNQVHIVERAISRPSDPLTFELWLDTVMPLAYPEVFPAPLTDEQVAEILTGETETSGAQFPVTVVDGAGLEVTLDAAPQRIVCMPTPCVHALAVFGIVPLAASRDNINAGLDELVLGDAANAITEIVWTDGYDIEAILAMNPDLVVSWQGAEEWMPIDVLRESVPVYNSVAYGENPTLEPFEAEIRNYGVMLGREADAEAFIIETRNRLEAYDALSEPTTSVAFVRAAPNENSFIITPTCGPALERLITCVGNTGEWIEATTEGLLSFDPDVLIVEDWGEGIMLDSLATLPLWSELDAVKNGRVYLLSPSRTIDYSLLSIANSLDVIMPLAYPDLFPAPLTDEQVAEIVASQ
jgi:iron complex transport system substrate-binding protein